MTKKKCFQKDASKGTDKIGAYFYFFGTEIARFSVETLAES